MTPLTAAAIYIGVNILLLWILSFRVVGRRRAAKVSLGTGGDADLEIRARAHGNASEYIPATMLGLFVMTQMAAPLWAIHAIGGVFTAGRLLHAFGLSNAILPARAGGMVLTWFGMLAAAGGLIWLALR
ncbi:MAG: glutathione S-transferase [Hyphomonas sp.]|uniref:MAPEG family protein n=1 Tax=Hyphomonas sp. TaxID=87 RepID=UPI001801B1B1|nr:MAPEG family protein [Hyphomonas sp.]MBA3070438.1 glutathione S-transferase [Hyphomonas sp.]MBU3919579.1 MAPEG family protein [Alphaproteobacteria bacterium]MBU4061752.1 MAPEG family protein [Alphaproteobacteria bacterium]MBU4164560.1 MAPEG family protein [Alphaproteobacteria bacterium]